MHRLKEMMHHYGEHDPESLEAAHWAIAEELEQLVDEMECIEELLMEHGMHEYHRYSSRYRGGRSGSYRREGEDYGEDHPYHRRGVPGSGRGRYSRGRERVHGYTRRR